MSWPELRNHVVTTPSGPSVAIHAKASGMPPKFAATPENVVSTDRIQRGVPSRIAAYATKSPRTQPSAAVTRLIRRLPQYASTYGWWKSRRTFDEVTWFALFWNAPTSTEPAGRNRNAMTYAKNGSVTSHAIGSRLRPDARSGRSASGAACVAMPYPPTFVGHSCAISAFAAVC